jgi:flavin reductase (DIM6/NTAB) family NADH-FMN oxidoreductase RutF
MTAPNDTAARPASATGTAGTTGTADAPDTADTTDPANATVPHPEAPSGADTLRRTLRRLASGVTVITVPGPAGFTATSFTSVSVAPPLVSFYVSATASSTPAVRRAEHFAAHVLTGAQAELAERFARSGIDRFADTRWETDALGVPLLHGVDAWLIARTVEIRPVGDHLLVVGEVVRGGGPADSAPLLHHAGTLTGLGQQRN